MYIKLLANEEPEVLHIKDVAKLLGRTESSIRNAITDKAAWLPPYFKQGARLCWSKDAVIAFLRDYEIRQHEAQIKKRGRPRKVVS